MAISFFGASIFPLMLAVLLDTFVETMFEWIVGAFGIMFAAIWLIAFGVRRRAGSESSVPAMTLTVVWAAAVLVAGATGWLWGLAQTRGPEDDFLTIVDLGVALGGLAVITFVVVSVTLSSVRRAASKVSS